MVVMQPTVAISLLATTFDSVARKLSNQSLEPTAGRRTEKQKDEL